MAVRFIPPTRDLARLREVVRGIEDLVGRPQPILKAWGVTTLKEIDENFRVGGRPSWKPLQPSTIAARRQGKGGGTQPLVNTRRLQKSFDFRVGDRQVTVFSDDPVAVFQNEGTRGPYEIRAKHGKALAIPTGPFTLAGLGKSRATGRGSFVFVPGRTTPKRFAGRIGKAVVPFQSVIFRQKVMHPGLPARPMLPTPEQLGPTLLDAAEALLLKITHRLA